MNESQDQITKLLQLKRHETPPEGYHEDFLREFQRRQRLQSMSAPWWETVMDKVSGLFPDLRVPTYAYATVGLFAVAFSAWILSSEEIGTNGAGAANPAVAITSPSEPSMVLDLASPIPAALPQPVSIPQQRLVGSLPPHYVLESRPSAEHEPYSF